MSSKGLERAVNFIEDMSKDVNTVDIGKFNKYTVNIVADDEDGPYFYVLYIGELP